MSGVAASHWTPDDLPALRQLVRLFDQVERGRFEFGGELRRAMDAFGLTEKGRVARRWAPAAVPAPPPTPTARRGRYGHLRPVGNEEGHHG